jgi:hypothetical protein
MNRDTFRFALTLLLLTVAGVMPAAASGRQATTSRSVAVVHHGYAPHYGVGVGWGGPYWGVGVGYGWGWPYWSVGYGWGWPYPGYAYGPPYPVEIHDGALPKAGALELHVHPWTSEIKVDGYVAGQARDFNSYYSPLLVKPGRHILELSSPGHMTLRQTVKADAGGYYVLRLRLEEGTGVDPRSTNEIPPPVKQPPAQPDDEGAGATEPPPEPSGQPEPSVQDDAQDAEEDTQAARPHGLLQLRVEPLDAAVYLDGKFLGRAEEIEQLHGDLAVGTGRHTIEAVRPGYRSASQTVQVGDKQTLKIELKLTREGKEL